MDRDGKYSLRACNIRLQASKAEGLVEYYTNKKNLAKSIFDEKLLFITNNKTFSKNKKSKKIKELENKYNLIFKEYDNFVETYYQRYNDLIALVSPVETSVESAEEQP